MAIDIYDLSFFQDDYSEEEELTEEERLKLQLEELGLEAEEDLSHLDNNHRVNHKDLF